MSKSQLVEIAEGCLQLLDLCVKGLVSKDMTKKEYTAIRDQAKKILKIAEKLLWSG